LAAETLETQEAVIVQEVKAAPMEQAAVIGEINGGEEFSVLGQFSGYWLVRIHEEKLGWLPITTVSTTER